MWNGFSLDFCAAGFAGQAERKINFISISLFNSFFPILQFNGCPPPNATFFYPPLPQLYLCTDTQTHQSQKGMKKNEKMKLFFRHRCSSSKKLWLSMECKHWFYYLISIFTWFNSSTKVMETLSFFISSFFAIFVMIKTEFQRWTHYATWFVAWDIQFITFFKWIWSNFLIKMFYHNITHHRSDWQLRSCGIKSIHSSL